MAKRAGYKRIDELASWDLNAGCRRWVNQAAPYMRKLKKKLRRQARKRLDKLAQEGYNKGVRTKGANNMEDYLEMEREEDYWETEDEYDSDYDFYDDVDETGFDPYAGCYTYDC